MIYAHNIKRKTRMIYRNKGQLPTSDFGPACKRLTWVPTIHFDIESLTFFIAITTKYVF